MPKRPDLIFLIGKILLRKNVDWHKLFFYLLLNPVFKIPVFEQANMENIRPFFYQWLSIIYM